MRLCRWIRYGRKTIAGWTHKRFYTRCQMEGCCAKRQAQRDEKGKWQLTFENDHNHEPFIVRPRKVRSAPIARIPKSHRGRTSAAMPAPTAGTSTTTPSEACGIYEGSRAAEEHTKEEGQRPDTASVAFIPELQPASATATVAFPAAAADDPVTGYMRDWRPLRKARLNARSATQMLRGEEVAEEPPRKKKRVVFGANDAATPSRVDSLGLSEPMASESTRAGPVDLEDPADNPLFLLASVAHLAEMF